MRSFMLFDYDLELLRDIVGTIDRHLEMIKQQSTEVEDPNSFGYFDRGEHVVGLGFVACQTYIVDLRTSRYSQTGCAYFWSSASKWTNCGADS